MKSLIGKYLRNLLYRVDQRVYPELDLEGWVWSHLGEKEVLAAKWSWRVGQSMLCIQHVTNDGVCSLSRANAFGVT